ncbi:MAG: thymidylate kinase [Patescibacteria group bacterium]
MPGKATFIVLEGTDGSGKATQAGLLVDRIQQIGWNVMPIDFPQYGTQSAGPCEVYLNGGYGVAKDVGPRQAAVVYAVDHFDGGKKIAAALEAGKVVVANRYMGSNLAHQGGKIDDPAERVRFYEWLRDFEFNILGIPKPSKTLVLHVASDIGKRLAFERDDKSDIHENDEQHLMDAEKAYLELCERYPDYVLLECMEGTTLKSREVIHEMVWQEVSPLLS